MEKPDLEPEVVAEVVAAEAAPERGKLLTRREAAERLGISETTLRRRERDELKPIVVDGVHMFEERQVRSVTTLRRQVGVLGAVDGGVAADVFELLRDRRGSRRRRRRRTRTWAAPLRRGAPGIQPACRRAHRRGRRHGS
jgi:hypothetical protein